ncbi:CsbD family protein [Chachezhania sediminis]|uniref:CsbD family protein n=1 Tax=Chachezhania sediminis TaxID=2599291 RepID=UPI00131B25D6|nr:CsbD family protein [Chachezhania sediminis]
MNWDIIEGNWTEWQGKVRSAYGKLTDDELQQVKGDREQLEGLIQQKYGKSKEEVRKELDKWLEDA